MKNFAPCLDQEHSMPTMKAAVVHAFKQPLTIDEVRVPEACRAGIVVKVVASGVCHTDLHAADGDWPVKPQPAVHSRSRRGRLCAPRSVPA